MVKLRKVSSWPEKRNPKAFARRGDQRAARLLFALAIAWAAIPAPEQTQGADVPAPVQRIEFYREYRDRPIEDKISLGDPAILDWQEHVNRQFGQAVRPDPARADHPLLPRIRAMLRGLPPRIHALASRHVAALYLLENDWGTGTTEAVQDEQGRWRSGYIALNLTVLERTANAWGSWKESSAFRPETGASIDMTIESYTGDDIEGALRFIFLHELGHVLGLALGAHGFWDAEPLPPETTGSPFVRLSWQVTEDGKLTSRWKERQAVLSLLDFYRFGEARLGARRAVEAYKALAETDFPSLYGATNAYDDWAEAFAIVVHGKMMGKPYRVKVSGGMGTSFTYQSCLTNGRCPEKLAVVERLIGDSEAR